MIETPGAYLLLLLLAIPALAVWQHYSWRREALPLNIARQTRQLSWTWRRSTFWVIPALRLLGLTALIVAAARPFDWEHSQMVDSEGIAIEVVIDRSGSMRRDDFRLDGRRVSRLEAVIDAASRFIIGDPELGSRHQDLIGLVTFAGDAVADCPLTLDHEQVVARLEQIEAAVDYRSDGTAIGDGLALAVAELQSLDKSLHLRNPDADITRIVVLLTDGEQNAGQLTPVDAARLARHYGIRTYVIEMGPALMEGSAPEEGSAPASAAAARGVPGGYLRAIAESTGGELLRVSDTDSLRSVYAAIDSLERARLTQRRLATRREWAIEWFRLGPWGLPPIAIVALVALAAETVLQKTVYLRPV